MKKLPTAPVYDPELPNQGWIVLDSEHAQREATSADLLFDPAEAALTTQGEEMRPKDGTLDGGTAR